MTSAASRLVQQIAELPDPAAALERLLQHVRGVEGAALAHDWEEFWARPQQLPPDYPWRSFGTFGGRGGGKTRANAEYVNAEAAAGRAPLIALIAQNEDKVWEVMIDGKSGLVATSPPWFRARTHNGQVVWPNGARAFVYTPERPDDIFGPEHHLAWCSEIHAWPRSTMTKAFSNLRFGLRLGYARMLWDSNPRRRHPLIKMLIERSMRAPLRHVIAHFTTFDNMANLSADAVQELLEEYGGKQEGEEMLGGKQFDDDEAAIFRQAWIDDNRRSMPTKFLRRVISADPAISTLPGTDATGLIEDGLAIDNQLIAIDDMSDRMEWPKWARIGVERYVRDKCDCFIVERNRGGDACVANIRTAAAEIGFEVIVLALEAKCPGFCPGVIHVKEVTSRQSKEVRAEALKADYEQGRASHVIGAPLDQLEEEMTTWVPGPKVESPNRLDAHAHAGWELRGLWGKRKQSNKAGFRGMEKATEFIRGREPGRIKVVPSGVTADLLAKLGRGSGWSGGL